MLKIFLVFLCLSSVFLTPVSAQQQDKTITGKIIGIDWLGRKITVRHLDSRRGRADHIDFKVPKDAELTRGSRKMSFLDLKVADMVTVTYYSDDFGGLKVRHLSNLNLGNR